MKGLLRKEFYMVVKYCWVYFLLVAVFDLLALTGISTWFFIFYPCMLGAIIPMNLMIYDEQSKWSVYSCTLPYTRAQLVSAKYLTALLCELFFSVLTVTIYALGMILRGEQDYGSLWALGLFPLAISCIIPALSLPFMFWLGAEKGRMFGMAAMIFVIVFVSGLSAAFGEDGIEITADIIENIQKYIVPVLMAVGTVLFAGSWGLSILLYKKREIG